MKKIACVGYHGTGAGVIDDLLRECDNVCHGSYEAEVRILHDPDGISDLEYHLVDNPHRLSSSLAIKRLIAYAHHQSRQAEKVFGKQWKQIVTEYAESLALEKYYGYTSMDTMMLSTKNEVVLIIKKILNRLKPVKFRYAPWHNYLPNLQSYYALQSESVFLQKTKLFVEKLCSLANKENKEFVLLDQFIEAANPGRYLRYVDDIKVVIVDRDPRDLYINQCLCGCPALPRDPHQFCTVYKNIRRIHGEPRADICLKVSFEDMIYKYQAMKDKVFTFLGIDQSHWVCPQKYFKPADSGSRTQLWKKYPQFEEDIRIIEKELPEFLYQFPDGISFDVTDETANNHHLMGKS